MHSTELNCTELYTTVHICTQLYTSLHNCTHLYTIVHSCTQFYTSVHNCTQLYTSVHPNSPGNVSTYSLRIWSQYASVQTLIYPFQLITADVLRRWSTEVEVKPLNIPTTRKKISLFYTIL